MLFYCTLYFCQQAWQIYYIILSFINMKCATYLLLARELDLLISKLDWKYIMNKLNREIRVAIKSYTTAVPHIFPFGYYTWKCARKMLHCDPFSQLVSISMLSQNGVLYNYALELQSGAHLNNGLGNWKKNTPSERATTNCAIIAKSWASY